jgi:hypothetical protein
MYPDALPAALRWLVQVEPLRRVLAGTRPILYFGAQADAGLTRSVAAAAGPLADRHRGHREVVRRQRTQLHRSRPAGMHSCLRRDLQIPGRPSAAPGIGSTDKPTDAIRDRAAVRCHPPATCSARRSECLRRRDDRTHPTVTGSCRRSRRALATQPGLRGAGTYPWACRRSPGGCGLPRRCSPGRCSGRRPGACRCSPARRTRAVLTASGTGSDELTRRGAGAPVPHAPPTGKGGQRHRLAERALAGRLGRTRQSPRVWTASRQPWASVPTSRLRPARPVDRSWRELTSDLLTVGKDQQHHVTVSRVLDKLQGGSPSPPHSTFRLWFRGLRAQRCATGQAHRTQSRITAHREASAMIARRCFMPRRR